MPGSGPPFTGVLNADVKEGVMRRTALWHSEPIRHGRGMPSVVAQFLYVPGLHPSAFGMTGNDGEVSNRRPPQRGHGAVT
jgi:hypothetical protein